MGPILQSLLHDVLVQQEIVWLFDGGNHLKVMPGLVGLRFLKATHQNEYDLASTGGINEAVIEFVKVARGKRIKGLLLLCLD